MTVLLQQINHKNIIKHHKTIPFSRELNIFSPGVTPWCLYCTVKSPPSAQKDDSPHFPTGFFSLLRTSKPWESNKKPSLKWMIWVCLKMLCTPFSQWFCWSLSLLNGYFIGKINPIFRQTQMDDFLMHHFPGKVKPIPHQSEPRELLAQRRAT